MQIYNQFNYFMSRDILIQHQNTKFKKLKINILKLNIRASLNGKNFTFLTIMVATMCKYAK